MSEVTCYNPDHLVTCRCAQPEEPFTDFTPAPTEAENFKPIVPRYDLGARSQMFPSSAGEWVRWTDVKEWFR